MTKYMKVIYKGKEEDIKNFYHDAIKNLFGNNDVPVKAVLVSHLNDDEVDQELKF